MFGFSYWFLPLFAGTAWLGTLAGMLGYWLSAGSPHYTEMEASQHIAYISDIGATFLKPLFIAGSTTMVVVFDIAFIAERWLRHQNRLTPNYSKRDIFLSICAIFFAIVGAAGLIFLSIFDVKHHQKTHDSLLVVFIAGYVISAIFICAEYQRLGIHYREYRILRMSFWIKLAFIFIEVGLAIAFAVLNFKSHWDEAAVVEWIISLIYIFYVWSFIIDFLPATRTRRKDNRFPYPARKTDDPDALRTQENGNNLGGPVYTNGGHQPMAENGNGRYYEPGRPASRNF